MVYKHDTGSAFIKRLSDEALSSAAINHPYLDTISSGSATNTKLTFRDFAFQYGAYSANFTRYVSAVIDNLTLGKHKAILLENLAEEQGNTHDVELPADVAASVVGRPHAQLYHRFQESLGVDSEYRKNTPHCQLSQLWSQQFLQLCQMDQYVGIGAIGIGTELIVSRIYQKILAGLREYSQLTPTDWVFFDLHSHCDDEHAAQLLLIAEDLAQNREACERIEFGTKMAINLRVMFWDKMLERSLSFPLASSTAVEKIHA